LLVVAVVDVEVQEEVKVVEVEQELSTTMAHFRYHQEDIQ